LLLVVIPQRSGGICFVLALCPSNCIAVAVAVAVAAAFAVAVAVASSCRHPERSEGSRRTSLTPTARTFPPIPSNARFRFFSPQRKKPVPKQLKVSVVGQFEN
jgi:hypothetical protein